MARTPSIFYFLTRSPDFNWNLFSIASSSSLFQLPLNYHYPCIDDHDHKTLYPSGNFRNKLIAIMKCLITILTLFQILPYIQCRPELLNDSHNKTGSWAKLARRLEFESHLELPSRFMRRYSEVLPTNAPEQLVKRSVTSTRKFMRRTRSARDPVPSRRYQRRDADKLTKHPREPAESLNMAPTPAPTGSGSSLTTVHITDENDFALLLPTRSDGESDIEVTSAFMSDNPRYRAHFRCGV